MPNPSDLAIVLWFLRRGEGWSQTELAAAAGVPPSLINDYEKGRKNLTRPRLEYLVGLMGVPRERIDATLDCLAGNRASARAPTALPGSFAESRREIEALSAEGSRLAAAFTRAFLSLLTRGGEKLTARELAERQFARLKQLKPAQRWVLVEGARD
jgi:transcriptional regulator with XRE-family HTH domain